MAAKLEAFSIDLRAMPAPFWMGLGEARAQIEYIDRAPLLPEFWERMHELYLVKGVQATTAIEGNSLSEDEVRGLYRRQLTLPPSRRYLGQEVLNVLDAFNAELKRPSDARGPLTIEDVLRFNAGVLKDLELRDDVEPGRFRGSSVVVAPYLCPAPEEIPALMREFVQWYNTFTWPDKDFDTVSIGIVKAIAAHVFFVLIHPFADGNGRTARFIEWRTLDDVGVPTAAAHLLSNHYNLTRARYYNALHEVSRGDRIDVVPFMMYAVQGFVDQLADQLKHIAVQYESLVFAEMARERDLGRSQSLIERRRALAIAISRKGSAVGSRDELRTLTPALAASYARAGDKTLSRDIGALKEAGLLLDTPFGWLTERDAMFWRHRRKPESEDFER